MQQPQITVEAEQTFKGTIHLKIKKPTHFSSKLHPSRLFWILAVDMLALS